MQCEAQALHEESIVDALVLAVAAGNAARFTATGEPRPAASPGRSESPRDFCARAAYDRPAHGYSTSFAASMRSRGDL